MSKNNNTLPVNYLGRKRHRFENITICASTGNEHNLIVIRSNKNEPQGFIVDSYNNKTYTWYFEVGYFECSINLKDVCPEPVIKFISNSIIDHFEETQEVSI